jgi:galactokinase
MTTDGVWFAPGRVNLIGEHTDYNDGFCLPFALPQRTTVAARRHDGAQWTVHSSLTGETTTFTTDDLVPGRLTGWITYVAGVVWALREAGHRVAGAELDIDSNVPLGAGLSSSHSLECAVLGALTGLSDLDVPLVDRPRLVQRSENGFVGAPTGLLDQTASLMCRAGNALFLDCRELHTEQIPFDLTGQGKAILIIDSKTPHSHADGEYANRRATCEASARALGVGALRDVAIDDLDRALARLDGVAGRRVRHVVTENQRVLDTVDLLRAGDVAGIGPLLTASHVSMRDDYEITVPRVDLIVETALANGAHGARMTGGGFGGCVLALIDADRAEAVAGAVAGAFDKARYGTPEWFVARASEGAGQLS